MNPIISGLAEIGPFPTLPIGHLFERLKAPVNADQLAATGILMRPRPILVAAAH